jgi:hypothetical protein
MYAICSTRKENVKKHVQKMLKNNYRFPVIQFTADDYDALSKDRADAELIISSAHERERGFRIDVEKGTLHIAGCKKIGEGFIVEASILKPKATGLKLCKCVK